MKPRFDVVNWGGGGAHWDRLRAALLHEKPDRLPVSMWRHFPGFEGSSEELARVHLAFQLRFGFDLMVFNPRYAYTAEPWGYVPADDIDEHGRAVDAHRPFSGLQRWPDLSVPNGGEGVFRTVLDALRLTDRNLPHEVPLILRVYAPLTTAYFLRGDSIRDEVDDELGMSDDLRAAVDAIDETLAGFCRQALELVDGLYVVSYFTGDQVIKDELVARRLLELEMSFMDHFSDCGRLLALHMHGDHIFFDDILEYPIDVLSWHDRWVKPSLRDARIKSDRVLMGGINESDTVHRETEEAVSLQVEDAISQVKGRGLIVAPGGAIKLDTPVQNIRAVIGAAGVLSKR